MYALVDDLIKDMTEQSLLELTDNGTQEEIVPMTEDAIQRADAETDGYLAALYTVPLAPVPPIINNISRKIAAYHLYRRKNTVNTDDIIRAEYEDMVKLLKDIAAGKIGLGMKTDAPRFYAL